LGTTTAIYVGTVGGTVILLTHSLPALLDKPGEPEHHLIEISLSCPIDTR
jgi:hypothetical protein